MARYGMNDWTFGKWVAAWTRDDLTKLQQAHIEAAKAWDRAITAAKVHREFEDSPMDIQGSRLEIQAFLQATRLTARARRFTPKSDRTLDTKELDHLLKLAESGLYAYYQKPNRAKLAYKRLCRFHQTLVRKTEEQQDRDNLAWRMKWGLPPIGPPAIWESKVDYIDGIDPGQYVIRRDESNGQYVLEDKEQKERCRFEYLPTRWDIEAILRKEDLTA